MAIATEAIISAASGLGGILSGAGIVVLVVKSKFDRVDNLENSLDNLKVERVAGLERRMATFEGTCQAKHERLNESLGRVEHMAANLENMVGWTKKLDIKLDRLAEQNATQSAQIAVQDKWLSNLDQSHQMHKADREAHGR